MDIELILVPRLLFYFLVLLVGVVLGAVNYKLLPPAFRYLTQMLCLIVLGEVSGLFMIAEIKTNYPIYHLIQLITIFYYGIIYYHLLIEKPVFRVFSVVLTILVLIVSIYLSLAIQTIYTFPSYASMILSVFVVGLSLLTLYQMLIHPVETPLIKQAVFWYSVSSLFFYTITFFIFGYLSVLLNEADPVPRWIYYPIWFGNYLLYGSYAVSLYLASHSKNTEDAT